MWSFFPIPFIHCDWIFVFPEVSVARSSSVEEKRCGGKFFLLATFSLISDIFCCWPNDVSAVVQKKKKKKSKNTTDWIPRTLCFDTINAKSQCWTFGLVVLKWGPQHHQYHLGLERNTDDSQASVWSTEFEPLWVGLSTLWLNRPSTWLWWMLSFLNPCAWYPDSIQILNIGVKSSDEYWTLCLYL